MDLTPAFYCLDWFFYPWSPQEQAWFLQSIRNDPDPRHLYHQLRSESWKQGYPYTRWVQLWKAQYQRLLDCGGRLIVYPAAEYPAGLRQLELAPLALSVIGGTPWQQAPCLTVVGGREASRSALEWLDRELGQLLRQASTLCLASGGARGIDQKAQSLALEQGQAVVIALPSGVRRPYPGSLREQLSHVGQYGGAIISGFAPDCEMRKHYFARRNSWLAALAPATLVVEARRRSGTLVTARWAADLGREVAVVPCSPTEQGLGGLDLLAEGASLIRDAADLELLLQLTGASL